MDRVWSAQGLRDFDEKIMRDQHALPRGLTRHFKVPKKPAPKPSTQLRPSVHQRPGPPVSQEGSNQSFQNGQQNKSRNSNFFSNAHIARGPLPRTPSRRMRGGGAKKTAGPSKGAQQWRSVGGGSPACFYPAMAKTVRWVQIAKNPAVRYPVEVLSASFDKDAHSFSNQEQETTSTEGRGQPVEEGGHRAIPQEPLPGLLQQTVSCSKEDWRSSSCGRPVHAEQTSGDSPFADRDGPDSQGCCPSGQMDGIYRHQGCLMEKIYQQTSVTDAGAPSGLSSTSGKLWVGYSKCYMFLNIKYNFFLAMLHIPALWYFDISEISPP